jgi:hypothetical protein
MKPLLGIVIAMLLSTSGCIVRTRGTASSSSRSASCPPAHHWEGGACVHNGRGRDKTRDHRR